MKKMMEISSFSNIVEENGKTIRQNNLELKHNIPINSIVEVEYGEERDETFIHGTARFYVVGHNRDCDGTPLYSLAMEKLEDIENSGIIGIVVDWGDDEQKLIDSDISKNIFHHVKTGFLEESLKVIKIAVPSISEFNGEYRFLSNFYRADVEYDGIVYPSSEHAYQAAKTLDKHTRLKISKFDTPSYAKKYGRDVPLRPDWENVKIGIMTEIVRYKFTKHQDLKEKLLATGDANLIEGNHWGDRIWGVCKGSGQNNLGKILMKIREELRCL